MRGWWALPWLAACVVEPDPVVPGDAAPPVRFGFPVLEPEAITRTVGVDHDPVVQTGVLGSALCADYLGRSFPYCYDEHGGSDYLLDGGFDRMDAGSVQVIAAADGVVVEAEDGHYDRCRIDGAEVTCDGEDMIANRVILEHAGGLRSWYWHLARDSVAVAVGDEVRCGDTLGLIGSSGFSSMPHLHFQVSGPEEEVIDPYAGPWSQEVSLWDAQGDPEGLPEAGCTAHRR